MKKILYLCRKILTAFIANPFWRTPGILIVTGLALILDGFLWYTFLTQIKQNYDPLIFSTGVLLLNLLLANYLWSKEKLASFFLLFVALFGQILINILTRFFILRF